MAAPTIADITVDVQGADAATHVVSLPGTVAANDLLILVSVKDGTGELTLNTDAEQSAWVPLFNQGVGAVSVAIWVKKAVGDEDGTTVTVVSTSTTEEFAAQVIRVDAASWVQDLAGIDFVISTSSASTAPDPGFLEWHWGALDTLIIAGYGADDGDAVVTYPYPTNNVYTESSVNVGAASMAVCSTTTTATSINPDAFSIAASEEWVAYTLAIAPAGASMIPLKKPHLGARSVTTFAADTTAHAVNMPTTVIANDLLMVFFSNDGDATVAVPAGWTEKISTAVTTEVRLGLYVKKAIGNEGGTTVDFVTSATEAANAAVYRWRQGTWTHDLADIEVGTATGTSVSPNPPLVTISWGFSDTLSISAHTHDVQQAFTAFSGGVTRFTTVARNGVTAPLHIGMEQGIIFETNPGTHTIAVSEEWVALTVAVRAGSLVAFGATEQSEWDALGSPLRLAGVAFGDIQEGLNLYNGTYGIEYERARRTALSIADLPEEL